MTTTQYFRGSNKKNCESKNEKFSYLKQLFQKRARLEYYRLNSEAPKTSASQEKKKLKEKKFYLETDLFEIKNLDELPARIKHFEFKEQEIDTQEKNDHSNDLNTDNDGENLSDELRIDDNQNDYILINRDESEDVASSLVEDLPNDFYDDEGEYDIAVKDSSQQIKRIRKYSNSNESLNNDLATDNYIYFQIENIYVMQDDIKSCINQNWLTNTCINAFMKTFDKNCYVLDYIQANKFMQPFNHLNKIENIFPKVSYFSNVNVFLDF